MPEFFLELPKLPAKEGLKTQTTRYYQNLLQLATVNN